MNLLRLSFTGASHKAFRHKTLLSNVNTMIRSFVTGNSESEQVVEKMRNPSGDCDKSKVEDLSSADRTRRLKRLSPNKGIYTCVIDSLCKFNLIEEAYGVLNQMKVSGFSPSFATMNDVLRRLIGIGKMRKAYEMRNEMIEYAGYAWIDDETESLLYEGLSDEVTYTSLMNAYLDEGKWDNAENLFYDMERLDKMLYNDEMPHCSHICTLPNAVKLSVFINGLDYKSRTTEIKKKLLKFNYMLFQMSDDRPIIEYRHTLAENSSQDEFKRVVKLVEGFCIKGLENVFDTLLNSKKPDGIDDGIVYNLSIIAHCERNNVDKAYTIYKEMVHSGFSCHMFTVFALITTLKEENMVNELRWVIENILRSCNLNDSEIGKFRNEFNPEKPDSKALYDVLAEKAKDGLFLKCSYAAPLSIVPMNMSVKRVRHFTTRSENNVKNVSKKKRIL